MDDDDDDDDDEDNDEDDDDDEEEEEEEEFEIASFQKRSNRQPKLCFGRGALSLSLSLSLSLFRFFSLSLCHIRPLRFALRFQTYDLSKGLIVLNSALMLAYYCVIMYIRI